VRVVADLTGRRLEMDVQDDGIGISPQTPRRSGLANLADRAERHGGSCSAERLPDGGTRLVWWVPILRT
jgi:signal transduction histidine kinase